MLASLSVATLASPLLQAEIFTYQSIIDPIATTTRAYGISNSGVISGQAWGGSAGQETFSLSGGIFTHYMPLNGAGTYVGKIKNDNVIAGQVAVPQSGGYNYEGFTINTANGAVAAINVPGASSTIAWAMNDSGVLVGGYSTATSNLSFVDNGGTFTTFGLGSGSSLFDINNAGVSVGYYNDGTGTHGMVRSASGTIQTLDVPNSGLTEIFGINNLGHMVGETAGGFCAGTGQGFCSFYYNGSTFSVLAVPGTVDTFAYGINDSDQIVGEYLTSGNQNNGFLATSVSVSSTPEPGTMGLLVACAGAMWIARKKR